MSLYNFLTSASQKVSQFILLTHDSLFGEEIYERLVKLGKKEETTTIELYNTGNNVVIREVDSIQLIYRLL